MLLKVIASDVLTIASASVAKDALRSSAHPIHKPNNIGTGSFL